MAARQNLLDVALYLLAVGTVRAYGYVPFDAEWRGFASKGFGGLAILALLPLIYAAYRSRAVLVVLALIAFENLQVALCSFWYIASPWYVAPGDSICSAKLGFDLGAVGIMGVAAILWWLRQDAKSDRSDSDKVS